MPSLVDLRLQDDLEFRKAEARAVLNTSCAHAHGDGGLKLKV